METLQGIVYYGAALSKSVAQWTLDHPEMVFFTVVFFLVLGLAWGFLVWNNRSKQERPEDREARLRRVIRLMAQRKAKLDEMYADMIGDMLFNLWFTGAISRQEYRRDSRRFGVKYKLLDLLPRRNSKEAIKARIRKNVAAIRADHVEMRKQLEKIRSGGFAVLEGKVKDMPNPSPQGRQVRLYLVKGKSLGLRRA